MSINFGDHIKAKQQISQVVKYFIWRWEPILEEWKITGYLSGYSTRKEAEDDRRKYLGDFVGDPYCITKSVVIFTNIVSLYESTGHVEGNLR